MERGVMINSIFKYIKNVVNKDKVDQEFVDRKNMLENPLTNVGNAFFDKPDNTDWFTFGGVYFDPHYT